MPTDGQNQNRCLSCGLCCDGTLFARSSVDATEPVEAFRAAGVRITPDRGREGRYEMLHWTRGDFRHRPIPEFKLWYDAWLDCLARAWLRNARKRLAGAEHFRSGGFSATAAEPEPVLRSPAGRDAP